MNMKKDDAKIFRKIAKYEEKLASKFPDIPKHDLHLILRNLLKPKSWPKRFLLRRLKNNIYVP